MKNARVNAFYIPHIFLEGEEREKWAILPINANRYTRTSKAWKKEKY